MLRRVENTEARVSVFAAVTALREQVIDELRTSHARVGVNKTEEGSDESDLYVHMRKKRRSSRIGAYEEDFDHGMRFDPSAVSDSAGPTYVQLRKESAPYTL